MDALQQHVRQAGAALTHRPWAFLWTLTAVLYAVASPTRADVLYLTAGLVSIFSAFCMLAGALWMAVTGARAWYRRRVRHEGLPVPPWPWYLRVGYWGTAGWLIGALLPHAQ